MIRSVLAVIAGLVALTVFSFALEFATNPLLLKLFPKSLPDEAAISFNPLAGAFVIAYSLLCIAFGGYVTAWIARRAPVKHALAMGGLQLVLTVFAMMSFYAQAPLRNWIAALLLTVPAAWCGGFLRQRRMSRLRAALESSYDTSQ